MIKNVENDTMHSLIQQLIVQSCQSVLKIIIEWGKKQDHGQCHCKFRKQVNKSLCIENRGEMNTILHITCENTVQERREKLMKWGCGEGGKKLALPYKPGWLDQRQKRVWHQPQTTSSYCGHCGKEGSHPLKKYSNVFSRIFWQPRLIFLQHTPLASWALVRGCVM